MNNLECCHNGKFNDISCVNLGIVKFPGIQDRGGRIDNAYIMIPFNYDQPITDIYNHTIYVCDTLVIFADVC